MRESDEIYLSGLAAVMEGFQRRCDLCDAIAQPVILANRTWGLQHHHENGCAYTVVEERDLAETPDQFGETLGAERYREWQRMQH